MISDRDYILDRLKSKRVSIEEFNYDKLQAPPLSMFFSPYDIQQLNSIARSIKYSAKPKEKYVAIDRIMNSRGLVKFAAGTNRVVYRHPEFSDILFKVAYDDIGLGDNPAEFRNQFLLKPFCTKMFEVSPCGTIAIVERVNPIQSREEYLSVVDDVFELITEFLVGKYVLADFGSRYFMNIGLRKGFGVVILDYPYMFEVDGSKLYCNKPDPTSISGKCDGEIDYDSGFNQLVCTKCGAIYKAKELEKKIANNELVVEREGEISMNIKVTGGSLNLDKTITTGSINNAAFKPTKGSITRTKGNRLNITVSKPVVETATKTDEKKAVDVEVSKKQEDTNWYVNGVSTEPIESKVAEEKNEDEVVAVPRGYGKPMTMEEAFGTTKADNDDEIKVEVKVAPTQISEVATTDDNNLKNPISFATNEEIENMDLDLVEDDGEEKTPGRIIDDALAAIDDNIDELGIDIIKEDIIKRVMGIISDHVSPSANSVGILLDILYSMFDKLSTEDKNKIVKDNDLVKFVFEKMYNSSLEVTDCEIVDNDIIVDYNINVNSALDEEDEEGLEVLHSESDLKLTIKDAVSIVADASGVADDHSTGSYNGVAEYVGKLLKVKDLLPDTRDNRDVIALVNKETNNYEAIDGKILLVDVVDDYKVDDLKLVTKGWFDTVVGLTEDDGVELESVETEDVPDEEEVLEESNIPVGVMSPGEETSVE